MLFLTLLLLVIIVVTLVLFARHSGGSRARGLTRRRGGYSRKEVEEFLVEPVRVHGRVGVVGGAANDRGDDLGISRSAF